ncbi:MAG TPA: hypothetical protein IAC27_00550 [Candidatus Enterenecus avicola]|nr:hypothetical protein [Candidatus Enterenecus avicola]
MDRFCAKHPNFGIPNLMKIIVFGQIAVYLVDLISRLMFSQSWMSILQFYPAYILHGQVWRLVTWVVVPYASSPFMLLLSCYFYYWIAAMLEREWGTARFTLFYLSGMVLSVLLGLAMGLVQMNTTFTISPINLGYYLNLSIFLVLAVLYGEMQVLLFFVVPVKMKWMALIDVVLVVLDMVDLARMGYWMLALVPLASFVNFVVFTWPFWRAKLGLARHKTNPKVIHFKQAQKKAQETRGYHHKCAVCGITDADDPDMEFRYCSKCDGYYCYCANHINNHVHIHKD